MIQSLGFIIFGIALGAIGNGVLKKGTPIMVILGALIISTSIFIISLGAAIYVYVHENPQYSVNYQTGETTGQVPEHARRDLNRRD